MDSSNNRGCIPFFAIANTRAIALVVAVGLVQGVFILQTWTDFWFDDDATLFAFVSGVKNPLAFFLSRQVIAGTGFSFTPMQMVSYWFDLKMSGTNPVGAYLHGTVVFILTAVMLFAVLRFSQTSRFSLLVTLAWMFLPSTIVIEEFIGARHYMEGLLLTLGALFCCYKYLETDHGNRRFGFIALALVCLFLAMLAKEVYVTTGFLCVFLLVASHKRYGAGAAVMVLGLVYACYRLWAVGLASKYPVPAGDAGAYLRFLGQLPYIFAGNHLGYLLLGGVVAGGAGLALKRRFPYRAGAVFIVVAVVSCLTIFPGSLYLSQEWQSRGTWYRLPFVLNLVLLIGGCLLVRRGNRRFAALMAAILTLSLLYGALLTRNHWNILKDRYAVTGRFYVANRDKLVYSEVPAYWYLGGLKSLYHLDHPFILSSSPPPFKLDTVPQAAEIWRYRGGAMVKDPALWMELKRKYR